MADREERRHEQRGSGLRPVPDPTTLTTEQLHREVGILRELIEGQLKSMDDLMDEKFNGVEQKFTLVERQRIEQKADAKEALAAALQAAEKAVDEQTKAARKDIDALGSRVDTALHAQSDAIGSITGRVTVIEAVKIGTSETRQGVSSQVGLMIAFVGLLVSVAVVVLSLS
jgi:hypothetical protein